VFQDRNAAVIFGVLVGLSFDNYLVLYPTPQTGRVIPNLTANVTQFEAIYTNYHGTICGKFHSLLSHT
jgi:hypothetical protein